MRMHVIMYAVFVASVLFDLATAILCFQLGGVVETNLLYRIVGPWAFLIVYLIDAGIIVVVEWLRKYVRWSPLILLVPTLAYLGAGLTNLQLVVGGKSSYHAWAIKGSIFPFKGSRSKTGSRASTTSMDRSACTTPPIHQPIGGGKGQLPRSPQYPSLGKAGYRGAKQNTSGAGEIAFL